MTKAFRVTPRAQIDIQNIGRYTFDQWGKKQRDKYLRDLDNRFHWLADHPQMGKHRTDIHDDYFCYRQAQHLIFYIIQNNGIDIIGIPHQAMDIINYFS